MIGREIAEDMMQLRPLSNKTWASIFIAAFFMAVMYFITANTISARSDAPDSPDAAQTE